MRQVSEDEKFMKEALKQAKKAYKLGEVPIGCVIVRDGATLEPCQMCAGALVQSRIDKVVIGCMSPKSGCAGSVLNLLQNEHFNHQVEIETGVLNDACSKILSDFFVHLRERNALEKAQRGEDEEI